MAMNLNVQSSRRLLKRPSEAFHRCPHCASNRIRELGGDHVFCADCDWDSLNLYAELQAKAMTQGRYRSMQ